MKFRYYITDLPEGEIVGTDSEEIAKQAACNPDYFVVDTQTGEWLLENESTQQVREFK